MDKHKHKPRDSKSEQPYILSGKLFCGFCDSMMTAETGTSHTGKLHHYYKCFGRKCNKHSCKEELESKISLEKARQIKPLEVDKVKAFLTYFARKKYENGQEKNEFFNSFINRVILYDDKVLIF